MACDGVSLSVTCSLSSLLTAVLTVSVHCVFDVVLYVMMCDVDLFEKSLPSMDLFCTVLCAGV